MIIVGPLVVLLMVLAWHPAGNTTSSPRRGGGRHARQRQPTIPTSAPATEPPARRWITGARESRWHLSSDRPPLARCGHRIRGPLHSAFGSTAPADPRRTTCEACCSVAALAIESPYRPVAGFALLSTVPNTVNEPFGRSYCHNDPFTSEPIEWPPHDPDEEEAPTRRHPSLNAALALLPSPDTLVPHASHPGIPVRAGANGSGDTSVAFPLTA
ncbi:hypothetical protein [Haloactinomyces albus]|uniref:Uncharacterized protein n=1 Tax=Haloactinomyces albus TaxID=1352928 RepID=A0AAE4CNT3_9ACTN|nr:hypothetical protein [Haloactinomyces albus]MDR7301003.1 hypothetical protein [Haloactinomyces albus]